MSKQMRSYDASVRYAANRLGITPEAYENTRAEGLKWCHRCKSWLPPTAFNKCAARPDGLQTRCRVCDRTLAANRAPVRRASNSTPRRKVGIRPRKYAIRNEALYNVWKTMLHRCNNPKRSKYKDYGGRGIVVCDEWGDFDAFGQWALASEYAEGLQIDRIDNDQGYSPSNCHFVTPSANSRNRRNNKYLTIDGATKCVAEWCESIDVSDYTIYYWIRTHGREYAEVRLGEVIHARAS